jgi:hypothetical protein
VSGGGGKRAQRSRASAFVLLVALGSAPACGEDDAKTTVDAFCSGVCDAASRCRLGDGTCPTSCAQTSHADRFSVEGAEHLGDCLTDLSCSAFSDDTVWKNEFDACWQSSKPLVPVTEHVRRVCARYVEAYFECNALLSTRQCELDLGMWSDDVLDDAAACIGADCDALVACLKGAFSSP